MCSMFSLSCGAATTTSDVVVLGQPGPEPKGVVLLRHFHKRHSTERYCPIGG
jgi:hypothetical protein